MAPVIAIAAQVAVTALVSAAVGAVVRAVTPQQRRVSEPPRRTAAQTVGTVAPAPPSPLGQVSDPGGPQIGIMGRRRVGGRLTLSGKAAGVTYYNILIAGSPVTAINATYIDNRLIAFDGENVVTAPWGDTAASSMLIKFYDGGPDQAADATLISAFPAWDSRMIGTGQTYARVRMNPAANASEFAAAYTGGAPDFSFDVSGFAVYDPRDPSQSLNDRSTWKFSENSALIAAGYLVHDLGRKLPVTSVNWDSVARAADICDEPVEMANGLTEQRYTCAVYWLTNERHEDVLQRIADTMAGPPPYLIGGKYVIEAGAFDATGAPLIVPNDYVDAGITAADTPPIAAIANGVRGQFSSPTNNFELRDYPAFQDAAALAEDGDEAYWLSLDLPCVTSAAQAQRVARIAYNRARYGSPLSLALRFAHFDIVRGDIIEVVDALADVDATFRVQFERLSESYGVELETSLERADFFDWTAATDEQPMPPVVALDGAGGSGVGVDPDDAGELKPPGYTLHFTPVGPTGSYRDFDCTFTFRGVPNARANQVEVEHVPTGTKKTVNLATGSATIRVNDQLLVNNAGNFRARSKVSGTGEASAWSTITNAPSWGTVDSGSYTAASTTPLFKLPSAPAPIVSALGSGTATIDYFASGWNRAATLRVYRNTVNSITGAVLVNSFSHADGSITETQAPGSTFFYFTRVRDTASAVEGPISNACLVAF